MFLWKSGNQALQPMVAGVDACPLTNGLPYKPRHPLYASRLSSPGLLKATTVFGGFYASFHFSTTRSG